MRLVTALEPTAWSKFQKLTKLFAYRFLKRFEESNELHREDIVINIINPGVC